MKCTRQSHWVKHLSRRRLHFSIFPSAKQIPKYYLTVHTWTSWFSDGKMTLRETFLPQKIHFTYKDSIITNRTRDWDTVCLSPVEFSSTLMYRWLFLLLYIIVVFWLQKSIKHEKQRQVPTYLSQPVSSTQPAHKRRFTYKTVQLFCLQQVMFLTLLLFRHCLFNSIGFTLSFGWSYWRLFVSFGFFSFFFDVIRKQSHLCCVLSIDSKIQRRTTMETTGIYLRELEFYYSDRRLTFTSVMVSTVSAGVYIYLNKILKLRNLRN